MLTARPGLLCWRTHFPWGAFSIHRDLGYGERARSL